MYEKVLIVEGDAQLGDGLKHSLLEQGYQVELIANGAGALDIARVARPDLVVLDTELFGVDGFEVCRALRREMTIPIVALGARSDEVDRVVAFEVGADDYITKPFSMRELLARIRSQLRRIQLIHQEYRDALPEPAATPLRFGDLEIDLNRCEVTLHGQRVPMKPKEYELLASLAQRKGLVLSREQLLRVVWGWNYAGSSRTVDVHIRWLREKIERDPGNPKRIITVRGMGYRFDG